MESSRLLFPLLGCHDRRSQLEVGEMVVQVGAEDSSILAITRAGASLQAVWSLPFSRSTHLQITISAW